MRSKGRNLAPVDDPNLRIKCELFNESGSQIGHQIGIDNLDGSFTFKLETSLGNLTVTKLQPFVIFSPIDANVVNGLPELAQYEGNPNYSLLISVENLKSSEVIFWKGSGIFKKDNIEVRGAYLIKDNTRSEECLGTLFYVFK